MAEPKDQLVSMQILRAFAALAVLVFHLCASLVNDFHATDVYYLPGGSDGVDVFFVISGFIMAYTTDRPDQRSASAFAIKRLVRILPLYWGLTLVLFAIAAFAPTLVSNTHADTEALWKSLLFVPYMAPDGVVHPLLILGWTLNFELFFYGVFTLCLLLAPQHRLWAAGAVLVALRIFGAVVDPDNLPLAFYSGMVFNVVLEFVWGMIAFALWRYQRALVMRLNWLWLVGLALLVYQNFAGAFPVWRELGKGLPAAMIVLGVLSWQPKTGLVTGFLAKLGDASYSLYLGHPYVIQVVVTVVVATMGIGVMPALVALPAALVLTAIASLASFALFERPTNDWLRKRLIPRPARRAPSASPSATPN